MIFGIHVEAIYEYVKFCVECWLEILCYVFSSTRWAANRGFPIKLLEEEKKTLEKNVIKGLGDMKKPKKSATIQQTKVEKARNNVAKDLRGLLKTVSDIV